MHVVGIMNETHSGIYYVVKNSYSEISDLKGYLHVSEAYMRLNTLSFTIHKKALPRDIRQRMGLERGDPNVEKAPDNNEQGATSGEGTTPANQAGQAPNTQLPAQTPKPKVAAPLKRVPLAKE